MKNRILYVVALVLALGLVAAACGDDDSTSTSDDTPAEPAAEPADDGAMTDLGGREVTVAVENAYLPFNYLDPETGEPTGWDYEVIDDLCARLNCTPVYEDFPWEPMIQAVADGQFDMAADGITITAERAEVVDFSDGYINIDQRLLVRADEDRFADETEFAAGDYVLATQIGTTNYDTGIELVGEDRVQSFEEFGFVVESVLNGDVDAAIIDETAGQGYIGANADQLKLVGESLSSDQLGFIFQLGSDLVAPFNEALASMKADGTLEEISGRYFGESFTISYDDIEFPEYEEAE
jgi:polar amino acid transport system substrate-binding protein